MCVPALSRIRGEVSNASERRTRGTHRGHTHGTAQRSAPRSMAWTMPCTHAHTRTHGSRKTRHESSIRERKCTRAPLHPACPRAGCQRPESRAGIRTRRSERCASDAPERLRTGVERTSGAAMLCAIALSDWPRSPSPQCSVGRGGGAAGVLSTVRD